MTSQFSPKYRVERWRDGHQDARQSDCPSTEQVGLGNLMSCHTDSLVKQTILTCESEEKICYSNPWKPTRSYRREF